MRIPIRSGWLSRRRRIQLFMDLTSTCNLHCIHCFREIFQPTPSRMGRKELRTLKEDVFPYVKRLSLSETGESLYVKMLPLALSAAKESGIPLVHIQTNGTHLSEDISFQLIHRGLDVLGISFDAATRETFEKIRSGADWKTMESNVRTLTDMRRVLKDRNLQVIFHFALMKQNVSEAIDFLALAKEWGADSVSYTHLFIEKPEMKEWSLIYQPDIANRLHGDLRMEAERLEIPALIPEDLGGSIDLFDRTLLESPVYEGHCTAAYEDWIFLRANGDCYPCFNLQDRPPLGNLFNEPFVEIWMSEMNQKFRKRAVSNGEVEGCDGCKFFTKCERKDREISYLAKRLTTAGVAGNER